MDPKATEYSPPPSGPLAKATSTGIASIGKSVVITGELHGSEDLVIEGSVDGKIEMRQYRLTIGASGKIKAQVFAKSVIVQGEVVGDIVATDKVDIRDNGSVDGDITSPNVAIAEGAHFRGSIDMQRAAAVPGQKAVAGEPKAERPTPPGMPTGPEHPGPARPSR